MLENLWKFSGKGLRMSKTVKPTFRTESDITRLPVPTEKPTVEYWHETQKGFGVRVAKAHFRTGAVKRTYIVRLPEGSEKDKDNLGLVGELAFDEAWDQVREKRAEAKRDGPGTKRKPTVQEAFDDYMKARATRHSPMTKLDYKNKMKRLASLTHGPRDISVADLRVDELDSEFWEQIHIRIREGYGPVMANRVCVIIKFVYARLVDNGVLTRNPVVALNKLGISKRPKPKMTAILPSDLPEVWQWMHTRAHTAVRDFMLVELFMGLRDSVVQRLRWDNVDLVHATLFLPDDEPGNKAKTDLVVPIPDYLMEHVFRPRWAARADDSPWVIPSTKREGEPLRSVKGSLLTMAAHTGIQTSPHDYRRTFGTAAEAACGSVLRVARLLAHNTAAAVEDFAVTSGYISTTDEQLREDMNRTAAVILKHATQPVDRPSADRPLSRHEREKEKRKAEAVAYRKQRVARNTELLKIRESKAVDEVS
ncbi:tyrosine-type recombinase/integrase [Caballeronia sp. LZ033]|uniref:tyrosine-type recombinase/integrase n=1 Tax=Caballeronia sp. LZ033 TaxID=3038566 RepID=UPI002855CD9A|nr:tyrosine-type recombinase/integrase [Caballeronia sp. LZ033]MDR5813854.1 tyrosine-type recombinase/integrase [Caballeronia sp. LZ033]